MQFHSLESGILANLDALGVDDGILEFHQSSSEESEGNLTSEDRERIIEFLSQRRGEVFEMLANEQHNLLVERDYRESNFGRNIILFPFAIGLTLMTHHHLDIIGGAGAGALITSTVYEFNRLKEIRGKLHHIETMQKTAKKYL